MNNFHYHQDPLYSAAARILEGTAEVQALVKDFAVGDSTNFGKVLEIGADSITFKAKDLPKTRITFNQRKMGSSEFLLTKLVKLKEETEVREAKADEDKVQPNITVRIKLDQLDDVDPDDFADYVKARAKEGVKATNPAGTITLSGPFNKVRTAVIRHYGGKEEAEKYHPEIKKKDIKEETVDEGTLGRVHRTRLYPPLKKSEDLVGELQTIIDAPDSKLWDVTSVSIRLSHDDIFDRFPKIYPYVKDMWAAIMTPDGARKTKEIAKKAIEAVHKHYPIKEETKESEETLDEADADPKMQEIDKKIEALMKQRTELETEDDDLQKYISSAIERDEARGNDPEENDSISTAKKELSDIQDKHAKVDSEIQKLRAEKKSMNEAINWLGDYLPTSEKSKFGGYRPTIINKKTKGLMYQSAAAYNTPQEAKDHAEDYLKQKSKGIRDPKVPIVGTYKEETEEENMDEESEIDKLLERLKKYPMRMRVAQAEGNSEMVKFYQDQKKKVEARIAELRSKKTNEEVTEAVDPATKRRKQLDMARVNAGAMSRDDYNKKYKLGKYRPAGSKLSGPGGLYKNLVKEVLNPDDEAGVWIDDFVNSDDPRFEGKSKEERIKMALGAWYAAQKKESAEPIAETLEEATMTAAEKKMAQEVHNVLKDGEQVSQAYGMWVRSLHNRLTSKFGKDWRKIAGIKEETSVEEGAETLEEVVALPSVKKVIDIVDEMSPKEYSNFLHALADNAFGIAMSTKRIKPNGPSNSDAWEDVADGIRDAAKAYDARPVKMSESAEEETQTLEEGVYPMTKKALEATFNLDPDEFEEFLKELTRKHNEMGDKTNYKQWYEVADHLDRAYRTWKKYAWDDFSDSF